MTVAVDDAHANPAATAANVADSASEPSLDDPADDRPAVATAAIAMVSPMASHVVMATEPSAGGSRLTPEVTSDDRADDAGRNERSGA